MVQHGNSTQRTRVFQRFSMHLQAGKRHSFLALNRPSVATKGATSVSNVGVRDCQTQQLQMRRLMASLYSIHCWRNRCPMFFYLWNLIASSAHFSRKISCQCSLLRLSVSIENLHFGCHDSLARILSNIPYTMFWGKGSM